VVISSDDDRLDLSNLLGALWQFDRGDYFHPTFYHFDLQRKKIST
jgi:hypothetical protein